MKQSLRFSLLTIFLVTTIVALGLALFLTRSRMHQVEAEARRLKNLFGELSIDDKSQVYVISVPTAEAWHWRWRIYLPGGHDFALYSYRGPLDATGLPSGNTFPNKRNLGGQNDPWQPREVVIEVALGKTAEGDPCLWISEDGVAGSPITFDSKQPSWTAGKMLSDRVAGRGKTLAANADVPLGLIAIDGIDTAGARSEDAVLIWIGRSEKTPGPSNSLRDRGILP